MLSSSVFEFPKSRSVFADRQLSPYEIVDELPDVPALPETLLAMELQLRESSVDLSGISASVLSDLGATIQILRLAGREYGDSEDRPIRIEDCICDLGLDACIEAASSGTRVRGVRNRAMFELWTHSREIAQGCKFLAEEQPGHFNSCEAYLVGLLHGIGGLPGVLGWDRSDLAVGRSYAALEMAEIWAFPEFLKEFFRESCMPEARPRWARLLDTTHELAMDSWAVCPMSEIVAPTAAFVQG